MPLSFTKVPLRQVSPLGGHLGNALGQLFPFTLVQLLPTRGMRTDQNLQKTCLLILISLYLDLNLRYNRSQLKSFFYSPLFISQPGWSLFAIFSHILYSQPCHCVFLFKESLLIPSIKTLDMTYEVTEMNLLKSMHCEWIVILMN